MYHVIRSKGSDETMSTMQGCSLHYEFLTCCETQYVELVLRISVL